MAFVDFKKVKETVTIEQTAVLLGLQTKPVSSFVPRALHAKRTETAPSSSHRKKDCSIAFR